MDVLTDIQNMSESSHTRIAIGGKPVASADPYNEEVEISNLARSIGRKVFVFVVICSGIITKLPCSANILPFHNIAVFGTTFFRM